MILAILIDRETITGRRLLLRQIFPLNPIEGLPDSSSHVRVIPAECDPHLRRHVGGQGVVIQPDILLKCEDLGFLGPRRDQGLVSVLVSDQRSTFAILDGQNLLKGSYKYRICAIQL